MSVSPSMSATSRMLRSRLEARYAENQAGRRSGTRETTSGNPPATICPSSFARESRMPDAAMWSPENAEILAGVGDLLLSERPERGLLHAANDGVGDVRQQQELRGPGQQEPSGLPVAVDGKLDTREDLRRALELVEHDWPHDGLQEERGAGLTARPSFKAWRPLPRLTG